MGALDRITHISAALLLCARGTYAQQATQAVPGWSCWGRRSVRGLTPRKHDQPHVRAPRHAPMLTGAPYLANAADGTHIS